MDAYSAAVWGDRPMSTFPISPAIAPAAAPAAVDDRAYAPTVSHQRLFRALSPRGLMLASIDSPQGLQLDRSPATTASGMASSQRSLIPEVESVGGRIEAGVAGLDARRRQLPVGPHLT